MTKTCPRCKTEKPLIEFHKKIDRGKVYPASYCKICNKEIQHIWYLNNTQKQKDKTKKNNFKFRKWANSFKELKPCTDCGIQYPYYVMDWDHLDDKTDCVSNITKKVSKSKFLKEIAKCELVCSNCHRIRTHKRIQL